MITHRPRTVPREGLANPVFRGAGATEDLIVSLSFLPGLTDTQMQVVYRWLRAIDRSADVADPTRSPLASAEPFVHEHLFHARVGNLGDPVAAVGTLVNDLTTAGVRIKDAFFACWERRPSGVMGPRRDPRAPREADDIGTVGEYLDRLWDPAADPPPSEIERELKGGFVVMDELVLEHRGAPLYFPGARIGYGIAPFEPAAPDERTEHVRAVLVDALETGWRTLFRAPGKGDIRPQPLNRDGAVDRIGKITCGTRAGYLFSIEAVQLLDRPSPHSCRFREYELMEAILDAAERLGLARVVTWQRFGTPTMMDPIKRPDTLDIQIWESGGVHSGVPGLDAPWAARVAGLVP